MSLLKKLKTIYSDVEIKAILNYGDGSESSCILAFDDANKVIELLEILRLHHSYEIADMIFVHVIIVQQMYLMMRHIAQTVEIKEFVPLADKMSTDGLIKEILIYMKMILRKMRIIMMRIKILIMAYIIMKQMY